jgi:hypothetical protein
VVFAADTPPAVRDALGDLLDLRRQQATLRRANYYQEYTYYPGETKQAFLRRLHVSPSGAADPDEMPYYLLLVGDPEAIPFSFQYQLDVQYAVGRVHFDSAAEYAAYAHAVVQAETNPSRTRRATFFGVQNSDDLPTHLSATNLVAPLAERMRSAQASQSEDTRWEIETVGPGAASKAQLAEVLGGPRTPDLLFTASHGVAFPRGHPRQRADQGALVCEDWPGPVQWRRELSPDFYFAADDVSERARLAGLITFHFACFGAGTPRLADYPQLDATGSGALGALGQRLARPIAARGFVARLAQRLLAHPGGGALATVGHVERALGSSFMWDSGETSHNNIKPFEDMVSRLMRGVPVGVALEPLNQRYAELCADLTSEVREIEQNAKSPDPRDLARLWTGSADARGYVIFGDPAVRLAPQPRPISSQGEATTVNVTTTTNGAELPTDMRASAPVPAATQLAPSPPSSGNVLRIEIDADTRRITVTTSPGGPVQTLSGGADEVSYGLFGGADGGALAELKTTIGDGLRTAAEQLGGAVRNLIDNLTTLEVVTYSGEDLSAVDFDATTGHFVGRVQRRAVTRMSLDGHTSAIVPEQSGVIDEKLWALHCQLVDRAQAQRAELLKTAMTAISTLASIAKPL